MAKYETYSRSTLHTWRQSCGGSVAAPAVWSSPYCLHCQWQCKQTFEGPICLSHRWSWLHHKEDCQTKYKAAAVTRLYIWSVPDRLSPVCEMEDRSSALSRMTLRLGKIMFQEYMDSILSLDQPSKVNVRWYAMAASCSQLCCLSLTTASAASIHTPLRVYAPAKMYQNQ